jgi:GDP-mannose 6-dehydrogenase
MRLSIFGLGYVGAVAAGCLASQGHEVLAFDRDPGRLDRLRRGLGPVAEPGLDQLIKEAVESGRLTATHAAGEAVAGSTLTSICIEGSGQHGGLTDLAAIEALCGEIGAALRDKPTFHAIVLRGTLKPGLVRGLIIPALERASGQRAGSGFGIALYPAFLRRGTAIEDYIRPPAIVLGATDEETLARLREMDIALQAPEMVIRLEEAESMMDGDPALHAIPLLRNAVQPPLSLAADGLCGG